LDTIIDVKRSFGGLKEKDTVIYPLLAKKVEIYLLKGDINQLVHNKYGSQIVFYPKSELIKKLRSKINSLNKEKILKLIKDIWDLDKGVDEQTQSDLRDYLN